MKVLNLDKLATKQGRQLVIGGKSYPIEEMTVSNFIETTKAADRIADASIAEQIQATIEMVLRSVPSMTIGDLSSIPLETLQMIVAFVRGDDVEGVESEGDEEVAGKK